MNVNSYLNWRAVIDSTYGSLDNFEDATTIRNIHKQLSGLVKEYNRIYDEITDPENRKIFDAVFTIPVLTATNGIADMNDWLAKRNLTI
jgi:hypothetical protein